MQTVLAYLTNTIVVGAICLVAGVILSQKIKDYITGAPAGFRSAMNNVEAHAKVELQVAMADVFAKFTPAVTKPVTATVTPAPITPVAAAPAPASTSVPGAEAPKT
jgi:hypothetical protein